jgi:GT2 family glycosyltransferase
VKERLGAPAISIAVVIPTRNREKFLEQILEDLESQTILPKYIVIVDSSDFSFMPQNQNNGLTLLRTSVKSAAQQRNLGLEYLKKFKNEFEYTAFLDDDIRIEKDYLQVLTQNLATDGKAVGISGLAMSAREPRLRNNWLLRWIGMSGKEGELTKGAINIPIRSQSKLTKVDWLIGCSVWKSSALDTIRFQSDFVGQSIFEDVIFSVEVSRLGDLIVNPEVRINHLLVQENRPNEYTNYFFWVKNRFRLKSVAPEKINVWKFIIVNFLVASKLLIHGKFSGFTGIIFAMARLKSAR